MNGQSITSRGFIALVLILQFVPLVMAPPALLQAFSTQTWFGFGLAAMALVAVLVILGLRTREVWPWYLLAFCHGFNVISRILMLWQNTILEKGKGIDVAYLLIIVAAIVLSTLFLWYNELPDVRTRLAREAR